MNAKFFCCIGAFFPAGLETIWKKRIGDESHEVNTYRHIMTEDIKDMVPMFHQEIKYINDCILLK